MFRRLWCLFVLVSISVLLGCGGAASSTPENAVEEPSIKRVAAEKLPPLAEYLPDQDDGRLQIAPPKGWHILGRSKQSLGSFSKGPGSPLPFLSVTASEPVIPGFDNVTEENVDAFAEALQASFEAKHGEKLDKNISEYTRPMILGETPYARYVKNAVKSGAQVEVQVLATIQGGRMYNVELQVVKGTIKNDRDSGYAVAAGLKFKKAAAPQDPAEKAEEKPAEKKETEEKK